MVGWGEEKCRQNQQLAAALEENQKTCVTQIFISQLKNISRKQITHEVLFPEQRGTFSDLGLRTDTQMPVQTTQ